MRRLDALYPAYGFAQHVGYITPGHSAVVRERGPCAVHRLSFQALCYQSLKPLRPDHTGMPVDPAVAFLMTQHPPAASLHEIRVAIEIPRPGMVLIVPVRGLC